MKRIFLLIIFILCIFTSPVYAEEVYTIDDVIEIGEIKNYNDVKNIVINDLILEDLTFLEEYKNIDSITINNSTIYINNLSSELINKINYKNCFITGEFNNNYNFKSTDIIINTEYYYNKNYDDEFSRMAKSIYKEGMSDEEIIKKVTLFVLDYMEYDYDNKRDNDNICYDHYGICNNYTELEAVLLSKLNIYTIIINGYSDINNKEESKHSWNMVYLNDEWYIIDTVNLDLNDSRYLIEQDKKVEYYMQNASGYYLNNYYAYYDYKNIPTDLLFSRLSILDRLDSIGEYKTTNNDSEEEVIDEEIKLSEYLYVVVLFIISIVVIRIIIKDKKKKTTKIR